MVNPAVQHARFLAPGDKLGKHELIRQIAVGGMAELYLARTVGLEGFEKLVVLKRILPQFANNQSFVSMFLNEARLAATLHHPNIAQVFDIGQDGTDYFFSMEYIHGQDLGHLVASASSSGVPISIDAALTLVAGLCAGLHYAHEKAGPDGRPLNVVHRDVSPSNVLVSYEGAVKLVDFGIARAGSNPTTTRGGLKGKIAYMSPEQCRGKVALDRRSDVFSIGSILYELTTGRLPFTDETEYGVLNQIVNRDAEPPSRLLPGFSPALEAILMRALARSPDQRYATALEMQKALEDFAHENRFRVSPLVLGRLMGTLYPARLEEWDHARAQGAFFVEQHVVRTLIENRKATESPSAPEPGEADAAAAPVHVNGVTAGPLSAGVPRARTGERARSPIPGTPMGPPNAGAPPPRASSPVIGGSQPPRRPSEQALGAGQMPRRPSEPTLRAPTPTPPPGTHPPAPPQYAAGPGMAGPGMAGPGMTGPGMAGAGPMQQRMVTPVPGRLPTPSPIPGQPGAVPIVTPYPGQPGAPPSRAQTVPVPSLAASIPPTPVPPVSPVSMMGSPIPPTPVPPMGPPMAMGAPLMGMPPMGAPMMGGAGTLVTSQTVSGSSAVPVHTISGVGEVTERVRVRAPDVSGPTVMIRVRRSRTPLVLLAAAVVIGAAVAIMIVLNGAKNDVETRPTAAEAPAAAQPAQAPAPTAPAAAAKADDPAKAKADSPPAPPEPTAVKADDPAAAKADDAAKAKADDAAKAKADDAAKPDDATAKADDPAKTAKKPPKTIRQPPRVKQTRLTTPKKDPKKTDPKTDPEKEPKWTPDSPFMPVRPPDKK